jgi:N-acetylneuraminate synthase
MSTFIIAEAGVNHNGEEAKAIELVDVAAEAGADAVKFQTFSADRLTRRGAAKAAYQERATGAGDQYDMLKALELSEDAHRRVAARCRERGIEFMSTAFDELSLDMLVSLGIKRIKVPSGEITNTPFLRYMAGKGLPLIVSTGMATMEEVELAVAVISAERTRLGQLSMPEDATTILHCTSNYPASPEDVNLRAMVSIAETIGLPVGYSDHTLGIAVSTAAVAMGARVIEKHFTLDKSLPGPDHGASLEPDELKAMVASIRIIEQALGDGTKKPTESELAVRALVRRSVTTTRDLAAGTPIAPGDVALMRPGTGIPPASLEDVYGRRLGRSVPAGTTLEWSDLE